MQTFKTEQECLFDSVEQPGVCLAFGTRLVRRSPLPPVFVDQDGLGRFSQSVVQQVQAVAQVRKARLSHPLQNLGQDPLARRVASLLSVDVTMLPSPSDFESFLVSVTQRADELEKKSMLRGLTLWKTWAHASVEGGGRAAHRWTWPSIASKIRFVKV